MTSPIRQHGNSRPWEVATSYKHESGQHLPMMPDKPSFFEEPFSWISYHFGAKS